MIMAVWLIHLVVGAISMFVTVVLTSSLLPSVLYTLPKALLGYFRGVYSWKLPLFYFGSILIWTILPGCVVSGAYYGSNGNRRKHCGLSGTVGRSSGGSWLAQSFL